MNDIGIIDRFLDVFSRYIDSGFGLVGGEVAWLSATLIVIDMTLAGLFWAMAGDEVLGKLIKKILYVGAFAFIITHFNQLAGIIFNSFSGLGLMASGSTMTPAQLLQPGRLAEVGIDAGRPIMEHIRTLSGFPDFFMNIDTIAVLFFAWVIVIISFFVLAVQLFVTLIEFKLTTLAGFVLVPFALWNKTSFLAERVLGSVMMSGVKVLVLAVIVGIGTTIFGEFQAPAGAEPSIDEALALMLASLSLFALGVFGPGIASGLIAGAPQLGAGAAAGAALGASAVAVGGAAAAMGAGKLAGAAGSSAVKSASSMASGAREAYSAGRATTDGGLRGAVAGMANVARSGASAVKDHFKGGDASPETGQAGQQPAWAQRLQRNQRISQGVTTTAHVMRSADHGGSGATPSLRDQGES
ncbi:P-type conjugative transfer protein TrbL [Amnimonas aquatica]|uniref:P-type conjugative transfer protein TrbL n=1 Tax=Amnimonas aquatica TaxID=2094561 RepID=A0A2P6AUG4_9GAMM|nr:P-type conjugative transfer protein TrbL [Amnimonas aquatica]PQA50123.1 P-type conjugative transfer protein TrbL [Amnimonas aquatica]